MAEHVSQSFDSGVLGEQRRADDSLSAMFPLRAKTRNMLDWRYKSRLTTLPY